MGMKVIEILETIRGLLPQEGPLTAKNLHEALTGASFFCGQEELVETGCSQKLNVEYLKIKVRELLYSSRTKPPAVFAREAEEFLGTIAKALEIQK